MYYFSKLNRIMVANNFNTVFSFLKMCIHFFYILCIYETHMRRYLRCADVFAFDVPCLRDHGKSSDAQIRS